MEQIGTIGNKIGKFFNLNQLLVYPMMEFDCHWVSYFIINVVLNLFKSNFLKIKKQGIQPY